jgi:hypothetical protein
MSYLDDILIYSANEKEHEDHVQKVVQCMQEFGLYCKAENWQFGVRKVGFLGIVLKSDGIGTESDCISTIDDWPTPESVSDVHMHLGFRNFNRGFIRKYAKVPAPESNFLKTPGSRMWEWTRDAEFTLQKLNRPVPKHRFSSISTCNNRSLYRPMPAALQSPVSSTSTMDSGFFGQSFSTPENAVLPNRTTTHTIGSSSR